jgi:hypothetical protein
MSSANINQQQAIQHHSGPLATDNKHKSFHLDTYCFDSNPERQFFWDMLKDQKVENI